MTVETHSRLRAWRRDKLPQAPRRACSQGSLVQLCLLSTFPAEAPIKTPDWIGQHNPQAGRKRDLERIALLPRGDRAKERKADAAVVGRR